MMREGTRWTRARLADLLSARRTGLTLAELGRQNGVSGPRIRSLLYKAETIELREELGYQPEPETTLGDIYVGVSADEDAVDCLFVLGEGIELKSADEKRLAEEIAKACKYASEELSRLRAIDGER